MVGFLPESAQALRDNLRGQPRLRSSMNLNVAINSPVPPHPEPHVQNKPVPGAGVTGSLATAGLCIIGACTAQDVQQDQSKPLPETPLATNTQTQQKQTNQRLAQQRQQQPDWAGLITGPNVGFS